MERPAAKADFLITFQQLCARLLSPQERHVLQQALQVYQRSGQVTALVSDTYPMWTSAPSKLQLLPFIRQVIALPDRQHFDALLGIHEGYVVRGPRSDVSQASSITSSKSGSHPTDKQGGVHVIKIASAASPRMGFSVRGGSEFGLGVFVSQVEPDSAAAKGGLRCGDQILESNGVDLENASSQAAVDLLSRTHSHTLVVRRARKIPEWKVTKERILWFDVASRKLVAAPSGEVSAVREPGSEFREVKERKVVLRLSRDSDFVGLNICGGKDFGLGIYVSRVDRGGLAERAGVEAGDQLVQINKKRLDNVSHTSVVQLLRTQKHLVLTLWAVGKFPAYKELSTEYVWSDVGEFGDRERTFTAELHPEPRLKARHKTGRVTRRTKTRESRVDRSPRDSGIDLNGIDLHQVELHDPDPDYDDVDLEDGILVQPELFYPRDQDIIFRGNYSENWRHLDKTDGTDDTTSTVSERKAGSSATYSGRAVSVADTDSNSSDEDMDYTTFLEHKARRDEAKARRRQNQPAEDPVLVRHTRHTDAQPSTSGQVIRVDPTAMDNAEPTLVRATDRREPALLKATDRLESSTPGATERTETTLVKAEDKAEPALVKTVIRVDAHTPEPRHETVGIQTQALDGATSADRREGGKNSEIAHREHTRHEIAPDGDVYAVVRKPPRRLQSQLQSSPRPSPATSRSAGTSTSRGPSLDTLSTSSRSSSEHSDDDSNSPVSNARSRHHRTHIYHINTSPTSSRKSDRTATSRPKNKQKTSARHSPSRRRETEDEEEYVVVTEVMDEVAIRTPSPSPNYRRASIASSTSNSDSTVTDQERKDEGGHLTAGSEGRKGENGDGPTAIDLLSEEISRLEARQSSIGSREIFSLGDVPTTPADKPEKEKGGKPEEEKKGGKWSAIKKKLTGSMRLKKGAKRPVPARTEVVSMGSFRKKGIFERTFGSQMMNQLTEEKYNLMMVEERARQLLRKEESDTVLRQIKTYHEEKDLDKLVFVLMAMLDRADKLQLLKDIRGVVLPNHVGQFDSLVAQHQQTIFDDTSSKLHLPLSPVHRSNSHAKPRSKLMTTVIDSDGHFHIQSMDQEERDRQPRPLAVDVFRGQPNSKAIVINNNSNSHNNNNNNKQHRDHPQQQPLHNPNNNRISGTGAPSSSVNGVVHRNRLNADTPLPPPPEWRDDVEVIIVEKAPATPPPPPPPPEEGFVVYLSKQKKNLGLIICGGAGDHMDSSVRIEMVMPWGAAADDERIQSGMHIVSVDDQPVKRMTQSEAIALLKRCFTDVKSVNMKLRVKHP